jgi:hypothetical protein
VPLSYLRQSQPLTDASISPPPILLPLPLTPGIYLNRAGNASVTSKVKLNIELGVVSVALLRCASAEYE